MRTTTFIDERGRVTIPKEIRDSLGLRPEQTIAIEVRKQEIVLKRAVEPQEFITQLKGCVRGSKVKPSEVKEIWGAAHAHH